MDNHYKSGSEWRKWDLHVHSPYTKLNNHYKTDSDNDDVWNLFCEKIEESDVSVFGITDYFSIDNYFTFIEKFKQKYPNSEKVFFPNIEFRIDSKNSENDHIQFHVVFSNLLKKDDINNFLTRVPLISTDDKNLTNKYCIEKDLKELGYDKAMVQIDKLKTHLKDNFTNNDYLIVGVCNGYGSLRPKANDGKGGEYAKELDKNCDLFFGSSKNVDFYLNKTGNARIKMNLPPKPVLYGCDAHNFGDLENKKLGKFYKNGEDNYSEITWIKADPTFEGLKQIIYEPESRVRIQEHKPEEKVSYQVIQSVEIDHEDCKQKIKFNSNLNTIIGGRSTGKSTLLKVIANKLKANSNFKEEYIKELTKNATIKWQDDEEKNDREIEYFEQNHMHIIAKNKKNEKDELLEKIVKEKDIQNLLKDYENFCENNEINIQNKLDELFNIQNKIEIENKNLKENGDKKGVENEIEKIKEKIKKIGNKNFTEENRKNFEKIKEGILSNENTIKKFENDISIIEKIKNEQLFNNSVSYNFGELLMVKNEVSEKFEEIKKEFEKKWHEELDTKKEELNKKIKELKGENEKTKDEEIYKRGLQYLEENKQHKELEERLKKEKEKLEKIKNIEEKIKENKKSKKELFEKIIQEHIKYKNEIEKLTDKFDLEHEDIKIKITKHFKDDKCREELKSYLYLKGFENQNYLKCFLDDYQDKMEDTIKEFLDKNLKKSIPLKNHKDYKELSKSMITKNWFSISYKLTYENDSFEEMSEGKKAFVILKLLLDFSNKKCPILIDQPEDSLDNRAIYNELVTYIRKKKIERQIVLVTHNANVVVNADAEEVIVANQHGEQSKNENGIKFQYISGSLEHTKNKDNKNILNSQGIKEHVCEILEGGKSAFEKRKQKYNIQ